MDELGEFDIESFKPVSEHDIIKDKLEEFQKRLKPEDILDFNGVKIFVPGIQPPTLTREPSLATEVVTTSLYIDDINNREQVTRAITTINLYLERYQLYWNIAYETIKEKLRKNKKYLGNTLYGLWDLENGALLAMYESLRKKPDSVDTLTLIIDYSNLKFGLERDCKPSTIYSGSELAQVIFKWITHNAPIKCVRIIISIQRNDIFKNEFIEFKTKLGEIFSDGDVIIIVGSDASSYDDLNIAYIVTNLLPESKKYIISSDKFRDLYKIETRDGTQHNSPIFVNTNKLQMIKVDIFCRHVYVSVYRHKDSRASRKHTPYGGTNKNKYTRKIKNSKKVKTLHKKRNTSKKVVKKYSKYNKNYKKKTLRRKNK